MKCQNCGNDLRDGAAFCTNCGTRIESEPAAIVPQQPPVNEIPEPPQMPEVPTPPEVQAEQPSDVSPPDQAPEQPPEQAPEQPPDVSPSTPEQAPYGAPPPYGTPPQQPYGAPPPYGTPPQQPYYQQPGTAYPQQPGFQPVAVQKKSKTGLIIGIAVGALALIGIVITAVILLFGDLGGGSSDPDDLFGTWEFESGSIVYYFRNSETIMFFENDDGTNGVYETKHEEWGTWFVNRDGKLVVDGEWEGVNEFTFSISRDRLTLTDRDGDTVRYTRVSERARPPIREPVIVEPPPTPEPPAPPPPEPPEPPVTPAPDPETPPPPQEVTWDEDLLGSWERSSGVYLYFFGVSDHIEFTDNGDGKFSVVVEDTAREGEWYIDESGTLVVVDQWGGRDDFTYIILGDFLTIFDIDMDSAIYTRVN